MGKDQSGCFQSQVFGTTATFLRYALLNHLNEIENKQSAGWLSVTLVDDAAVITYAYRIWDFFRGLFRIRFSKVFELFKIEDDFQSYFHALE